MTKKLEKSKEKHSRTEILECFVYGARDGTRTHRKKTKCVRAATSFSFACAICVQFESCKRIGLMLQSVSFLKKFENCSDRFAMSFCAKWV